MRLSCSRFPASALDVWHVVISPDAEAGGWFDEYDLLALVHLYDGRAESTRFRENLRFVPRGGANPAGLSASDFLAGLKPKNTSRDEAAGVRPAEQGAVRVRRRHDPDTPCAGRRPLAQPARAGPQRARRHPHPGRSATGPAPRHAGRVGEERGPRDRPTGKSCWRSRASSSASSTSRRSMSRNLVDTLTPTFTDGRIYHPDQSLHAACLHPAGSRAGREVPCASRSASALTCCCRMRPC